MDDDRPPPDVWPSEVWRDGKRLPEPKKSGSRWRVVLIVAALVAYAVWNPLGSCGWGVTQ